MVSESGRVTSAHPTALAIQTLVIHAWLPKQVLNGSHGHWSTAYQARRWAKTYVWAAAKNAGWRRVSGKARLAIELVFPVNRRRDHDNLVARCKPLVDGLVKGGYLEDDDLDHLELEVNAVVEPGVRETRVRLEEVGEVLG